VVSNIGDHLRVKCIVLTGGNREEKDISSLRAEVQVVVAKPGQVMDMLRRRALDFKFLKVVILDEADEMLSVGFEVQLQEIFKMKFQRRLKLESSLLPCHQKSSPSRNPY